MNEYIKEKVEAFGQVFTPRPFAQEMLDTIPSEFWDNPNIRVIDNSCGQGVFLELVKDILLDHGHSEKHILDNMIYGVELQEDNYNICLSKGFVNIANENALKFDYWDKTRFDLVVGNPPYNKDKTKGKRGNVTNPLWTEFVEHAVNRVVKNDGYLLFVHPILWRKPEHKIWELFSRYQVETTKFFDLGTSTKIFNAGTKVDYYLLKKTEPYKETKIIDVNGIEWNIDLSNKSFIPNHSLDKVYEVFSGETDVIYGCQYHHYTKGEGLINTEKKKLGKMTSQKDIDTQEHKIKRLEDNMEVSVERVGDYVNPCIYLINNKGIHLIYSKGRDHHFDIPKVIISMGKFKPVLDSEGKYGMGEITFGIPIENEEQGKRLVSFLESDDLKNIMDACKWKLVQTDYKLFRMLNMDKI